MLEAAGPTGSASQGARHRHRLQNSVADAAGHAGSTPRGPAINIVLDLGRGHCRTRQ
jgi:hypothetical protein